MAVRRGARVLDPGATAGRVALRVLTALAASSTFYAAVHFLARPETPAVVTWGSGLSVLGGMLGGLGDVGALVPAFVTLWVVGASLGALSQRAGTLFASVGVHAGGIVVLQVYGLVTTEAQGTNSRLWGTGRLVDGWVALGVVLAALGVARATRAYAARRDAAGSPVVLEQATAAA